MENISQPQPVSGDQFVVYRDKGVWVALVISGFFVLPALLQGGGLFERPAIGTILFMLGWVGYIIFRKGKSGSFVVGFIIGIFLGFGGLYILSLSGYQSPSERRMNAELEALLEQTSTGILNGSR